MDSNRQFVAGPVAQGTPGFIQVEQAILRGCGARWRFPEYFSGDASNNNMASSIVAGSPFVVAVEGNQLEWGVFERAVAKKVLELCVESGRLSRELVASVDVKVIPPAVALANREEEEKLREMRHKAGVLSVTTWQQQVGLDPKHEATNFEAEARRKGVGGGEKTVGESEGNFECEEEISEGSLKGKKFTGEIRDSLGRRRCYQDGRQIACEKGDEPEKKPDPKPALDALKDAQKMEQQKRDDNRRELGLQSLSYAYSKARIDYMKKAKNGAGEEMYGKAGYEKYTELVDDYEAITEELLKAPPIARETSGIISGGRVIYHFKGPKEGEELEELPRALHPETLNNIKSLLHEIDKQAEDMRIKPRGLSGMAYGFAKASDNLVTGILELYKAPGALMTLLTDAEAQKNLYEELKKGVRDLRDGDAEAWGGAVLNTPLTITGVAGAAKGTAAVTRITLKVSKATAKKLVASGLKGKALIRALLKADAEAAAAAAKNALQGKPPRLGERRISDALYEDLRAKTPSPALRDDLRTASGVRPGDADPILPGQVIGRRPNGNPAVDADHIVSMDTITRMEGFDRLTTEQQLQVLNNRDNFVVLSEAANRSKGAKSFADWTHYKKGQPGEIAVEPAFRQRMIQEEQRMQRLLQQQIDRFLK